MKYLIATIFSLFLISSCDIDEQATEVGMNNTEITDSKVFVNIVVGSDKKETTTKYRKGASALEALQYVANVVTKPVAGKYVFVTKIDSIEGIKGKNGWYYTINGNKATKLAINQTVQPGDTIQWNFKADICSKTVDKEGCKD